MLGVAVVVFVASFVLVLLLGFFSLEGSRESQQTKMRLAAIVGPQYSAPIETPLDIRREEPLTGIPWVNELLRLLNVLPTLRKTIRQAGVDWKPSGLTAVSGALLGLGAAVVYLRTESLAFAALAGALVAALPWLALLRKRAKRFAEFEEKLPEAIDMIVGAIRAGHGFTSALGLTAKEIGDPISSEFRQCFDEQNFGLDLRVAIMNLVDRIPTSDMRFIAAAVVIQKESGGNLAEILEKGAHIVRERSHLNRQVKVHTAQGRLTGWLLGVMPVIFGVLLYMISPERMSILWHRPIGIKLLWGAAIMDVIGALIIKKIVSVRI